MGQRRVDEGGRAIEDWDGPPWAPTGIGLYERDTRGGWWPTQKALDAGYLPCSSCQLTARKTTIAVVPRDPDTGPALIAAAQAQSVRQSGRGLDSEELERVLAQYPEVAGRVARTPPRRREPSGGGALTTPSAEIQGVIERVLDLREAEAPLGDSGYRGPFTQAVIAKIAGVPVRTVTAMAVERDRRRIAGEPAKD